MSRSPHPEVRLPCQRLVESAQLLGSRPTNAMLTPLPTAMDQAISARAGPVAVRRLGREVNALVATRESAFASNSRAPRCRGPSSPCGADRDARLSANFAACLHQRRRDGVIVDVGDDLRGTLPQRRCAQNPGLARARRHSGNPESPFDQLRVARDGSVVDDQQFIGRADLPCKRIQQSLELLGTLPGADRDGDGCRGPSCFDPLHWQRAVAVHCQRVVVAAREDRTLRLEPAQRPVHRPSRT